MPNPRSLCRLLLVVCVALAGVPVNAAGTPLTVHNEYTRHVWRAQDGLPEDTVQAIAQDGQGFLWLGTTGGAARFDGSEFSVYDISSSPRLPVNSIFCLLAARDGSLWMGSEGGGLLRMQGSHLERYDAARGLADPFVRALLEDERGQVWVGTDNGLYVVRTGSSRLGRVDGTARVPALAVHAIAEDSQHRIWVGGSRLLVFNAGASGAADQPASAKEYPLPGKDSQNRVKSILAARDGTVWVGTVGGLLRLGADRFEKVPALAGTVRTLRQTDDGTIWIGTIGHGLWRTSGQRLERVDVGALLPSKSILSVYEDRSHQIWVGTQSGLVRLNQTPVHVLPLPESTDPDFETISADRGGGLWVVASSVYRIERETAKLTRFPALGNPPVRNLFRSRDGALWVGTDGEGAYRQKGAKATHVGAPGELPNNFVRAFLEGRRGDMWIATDEGVAHLVDGRVRQYGMRDGLVYFSTRSLLETADGSVWIGTEQGLSHWRDGAFVHDAVTDALKGEKVWALAQDSTGVLWIGTRDHGLFRVRGAEIVPLTREQGLPVNSIYSIAESAGRLWFSGPNTLFSASLHQLDQIKSAHRLGQPGQADPGGESATTGLVVESYALPFSAGDAQFYGGRQPSVCVDQQGRVWFPSSRGVLYIEPGEVHPQSGLPLSVFVHSILVDGQPAAQDGPVRLAARNRDVVLSYAPLLLGPQAGVRFRYKLEGFDKAWTYAGSLRTAAYNNLPAGRYRFVLEAMDGGRRTAETTVSLVKQPFFWQTGWFAVLALLLLGGAAMALYRLRIRRIQDRFKAVLIERGRLAREMHDTVIQGCTSISALLEAIASRRSLAAGQSAGQSAGQRGGLAAGSDSDLMDHDLIGHNLLDGDLMDGDPLAHDLLDHARQQVRTTIDEARQAVWNLRHREEPEQSLPAIFESLAANVRLEFGVAVSCRWEGEGVRLAAPLAHEVSMTVREALCNAALHGRPSTVELATRTEREHVFVSITDDGVGFVPHEDAFHYGITGMRERAARLGGTLAVESAPGSGTRVALTLVRETLTLRAESSRQE